MVSDLRLIGLLSRALNHELSAVQQYLAQATLTALWGMEAESKRFREDVHAELRHAEQLMETLLSYGVAPGAAQLSPVRMGRTLAEMLAMDRVLEVEAVRIYEEAVRYCERIRAAQVCALLSKILEDEVAHIKELDEWRATLPKEAAYG